MNPFPDQRDLYVLVAGLLLGLVLSSSVLGRVMPERYEALFLGAVQERETLDAYVAETEAEAESRISEGVTEDDLLAYIASRDLAFRQLELELLMAGRDHARSLERLMTSLILVVLALMVAEAMLSPIPRSEGPSEVKPVFGRLKAARYVVLAGWLALAVSHPGLLLAGFNWLFVVILLAVVFAAALVPLGPRKDAAPK